MAWPRRWARRLLGPSAYDELAIVRRCFGGRSGVLLDVGAHHGESLRPFAEDGWVVHAFEPDASNRHRLLAGLKPNWRVTVDPRAVSDLDGGTVELFTSSVSSGISTLMPFHPSHRPTSRVETVRLDTYLASVDEVTVIKTDTEGYDLPVLQTFPWHRLRPSAVVCEFEDRKTAALGYTYDGLADFLTACGYAVLVSEWFPVVEYGRPHRWRSVRRYPTQLTDPAAWGNLMAVDPIDADRLEHAARLAGARLRLRRIADSVRATGGSTARLWSA